mgnify:CR=1 FL=1
MEETCGELVLLWLLKQQEPRAEVDYHAASGPPAHHGPHSGFPQIKGNPLTQERSDARKDVVEDLDLQEEDEEGLVLVQCNTCPEQGERLHQVISERNKGEGVDVRVRCEVCSSVHVVELRPPRPLKVPITLSDGSESFSEAITIDNDETITVGDEFEHSDQRWEIRRIESSNNDLIEALATEIRRLWAVRTDIVRIKVTYTKGEKSTSEIWTVEPDTIFTADATIETPRGRWMLRAIHTGRGRRLRGSTPAFMIRRIFLHALSRR